MHFEVLNISGYIAHLSEGEFWSGKNGAERGQMTGSQMFLFRLFRHDAAVVADVCEKSLKQQTLHPAGHKATLTTDDMTKACGLILLCCGVAKRPVDVSLSCC